MAFVVDGDGNLARVDRLSHGVKVIDPVHARIHEGKFYTVDHANEALGDDANLDLLLVTPSTPVHLRVLVAAGGDARLTVYEGVDATSASSLVPVNRNRRSENVAATQAYHSPSFGSPLNLGTAIIGPQLIPGGTGPANSTPGAAGSAFEEVILAPNTKYLVRLTNIAGTAQIDGINLAFYEPGEQ